MKIGIDKLAFHVPPYYIDMTDLAAARGVDPNKFHIGLGQDEMAIIPHTQDIVTLGAQAAANILTSEDKELIDMVIVGTESSHDFSKASAVVIHHLLHIQPFARSYEIKQACYGGTAALMQAVDYVQNHPTRKVLVIASDISKYGLHSGGEPTQGAGAVAMLISSNPHILTINRDSVFHSEDVYDFWRPAHHDYPLVDGHKSNAVYVDAFTTVWKKAVEQLQVSGADYEALCFHLPYTKMGRKALQAIAPELTETDIARIQTHYEESIAYSRRVGNLYTGSLYLGLISLLENGSLAAGATIGLFSYGSGAVSEFFSGTVEAGYKDYLLTQHHQALLQQREQLTISEYEAMFAASLPKDGSEAYFSDPELFSIQTIAEDIRYYRTEQANKD